jgi:hypothetical protein
MSAKLFALLSLYAIGLHAQSSAANLPPAIQCGTLQKTDGAGSTQIWADPRNCWNPPAPEGAQYGEAVNPADPVQAASIRYRECIVDRGIEGGFSRVDCGPYADAYLKARESSREITDDELDQIAVAIKATLAAIAPNLAALSQSTDRINSYAACRKAHGPRWFFWRKPCKY